MCSLERKEKATSQDVHPLPARVVVTTIQDSTSGILHFCIPHFVVNFKGIVSTQKLDKLMLLTGSNNVVVS